MKKCKDRLYFKFWRVASFEKNKTHLAICCQVSSLLFIPSRHQTKGA